MKWKNSFFVHFQVSLLIDCLEMRRNDLCIFIPSSKSYYSCMIAAISWVLPLTKYSYVVCMSFGIILLVDFIQSSLCFFGTYCLHVFLLQEHNNFTNCWSWTVIFSTCITEFDMYEVWTNIFRTSQLECYLDITWLCVAIYSSFNLLWFSVMSVTVRECCIFMQLTSKCVGAECFSDHLAQWNGRP